MDDLDRIERNYGCVAEYNRCMAERDEMDYFEMEDGPIPYEEPQKEFEVGMHCRDVEPDGGLTHYKISRISKNRDKIFVTERWANVDGCGKRKPRWHKVIRDDEGYEKFLITPGYDSWLSVKQFNL